MPKKYGIVLVFDDDTNREAIGLSARYLDMADDASFALGTETNVPHLSLLHIMLDDGRVGTCLAALRHALRNAPAQGGVFDAIESRHRYLFWLTEKTEPLARLQLGVVSAAAHLRSGPCKIGWRLDTERKRMMARYGYPNVGPRFHPHVTLRTVRPEFMDTAFEECEWSWTASHIAFCRADDMGAMKEVIERIPLVGAPAAAP